MSRTLFPVFLDLDDRLVVVVGGGAVATERAAKLAAHGARVRVVSPEVSPALAALIAEGTVVDHHPRAYAHGDLDGAVLVIAATVIGGTALAGGSGTILGSVLGALIMQCIDSGMLLLDVSIGTRYIIIGQVLIAAVVFDVAYRKWTGDVL